MIVYNNSDLDLVEAKMDPREVKYVEDERGKELLVMYKEDKSLEEFVEEAPKKASKKK